MKIMKQIIMILCFIPVCVLVGIYIIRLNLKAYHLKQLETDDEKRFQELEEDTEYLINQIKLIRRTQHNIKHMKAIITAINKQQEIVYGKKLNSTAHLKPMKRFGNITSIQLETIIIIQVHGNYRDLIVFLQSLSRVVGISESLLIFGHNYYDSRVYKFIRKARFARVMQIFYPYSVQLHPYRYPGEDPKFCEKLSKCVDSNERDPINAQTKLFWWWMVNQVFDHIDVLQNYDGYLYFLEINQYLTNDFLFMAKKLEQFQPLYCPECHILSLAARSPRPEYYSRENSSLIISNWGRSKPKYISSGIGFNRTTWSEIKRLKEQFCYFDDFNWENSLKYLVSKTYQKQFYMLSTEGARVLPSNDCSWLPSNGTRCDVDSTYKDIEKFINTISSGLFPYDFKLEVEGMGGAKEIDEILDTGGWDDARDREMCMFIASNGRRVYY